MAQKPTKEQMPAMIAEVVNRSKNLDSIEAIKKYLARVQVSGDEVLELGQAMFWLQGMSAGEKRRVDELKALLPQKDTEIKIADGPEEPEAPQEPPAPEGDAVPAVAGQPAAAIGGVELSKGSEVLQPA